MACLTVTDDKRNVFALRLLPQKRYDYWFYKKETTTLWKKTSKKFQEISFSDISATLEFVKICFFQEPETFHPQAKTFLSKGREVYKTIKKKSFFHLPAFDTFKNKSAFST